MWENEGKSTESMARNYMSVFPAQLTYPSSEKLCMDLSHMQKSVVLNITLETKVTTPILLDRFIWHKEQLKCFTFPKESLKGRVARLMANATRAGLAAHEIQSSTLIHIDLGYHHYLVAFPAVIHHPSTETFCVLLHSLPETVHLTVTLETKIQKHTLLDKDVEKPGTYECPDFQETGEEVAHVHVLIQKGDSVSFEGRKKVVIRKPRIRNIIELDKPFYKPGETAKVRIVRLDEEFKAIEEPIPLIQLIDPNKNRIGQWVDVKPHHGIVDLSFPLASEATLGRYIIKLGERYKERRTFQVEEYVPHKFEVSFEVPQLVTTADKEVQVKVIGRYTYGKPVQGKVHLKLSRGKSFYFFGDILSGVLQDIDLDYKGQTDKTGCATFTINATDLNLSGKGYRNYVQLSADLEEDGTGVTLSGEHLFAVVTRAIEIEFVNLNPYYKHGFPYKGKMKFTVSGVPFKNQTVYLTVDVNDVETHLSYVTDDNGEVHFSLDTTEWKNSPVALRGRSIIYNVTQPDASDVETIRNEAFRWVKPFYSESNSFLEIKHVDEELPCGKDQEVLVDYILDWKELDPEADHVDFYYLVVSRGRIIYSGQKQVPVGKDETLKGTFSLTLSTSSDLAPMARLLLYSVFADGEVAADVEIFTIDTCFKHKVKVDFSEKEELPGSKVNLEIEAAPGALCSLRAIDKSHLNIKLFTNTKVKKPVSCEMPTLERRVLKFQAGDPVVEEVSLQLPEHVVKDSGRATVSVIAFVAKAFGQAKSYIYIEEKHIHDAVHWLGEHQLPSGCFESVGKLFNNALKGAVDDDLSLTAYITASLLELHLEKNGTLVDDALLCMKKNLSSVDGTYTKALLAYVFTLARDTETQQQLLKELEEQADKTDGTISFSETETTAYFLLAYLSMPEVSKDKTSQIVRALTQRQNPYGGFSSTQDTVVGMQALAKYAGLTYREIEDLKVVVKSGEGFQHEFHVNKKNQLVLQQAPLPDVPAQYKVEVSGNGCAYVQTTLRYNHPPEKPDVFALSVATSPKECNQTSRKYFDILLQVSYTGPREASNMALIEVNMLSGFIPMKKSARKLEESTHVKKVELDPDRISIYLDELDKTVQSYRFSVEQEFEVTDLKPAIVKVYDYYHPAL
ncbi:hypothetical protein JD844_010037 [Phrynosoma platyrhinos]|uniref:Alpha-2-macroglobulin n=1 Tax=Phrynosoma platyrhinos TaxID=52577 RepID=A0ABQ7TFX7_PHRPL|nr:hypothetical protein JD844_010037 [Phrynosoma platyrhinos]